jgi:hypothetical protein
MTKDWIFDLLLELTEKGYRAVVRRAPAGTASEPFVLPLQHPHNIGQQLLVESDDDSPLRSAQFALAREAGGTLFHAIFTGSILECWQQSWQQAYSSQATLRVQLTLDDLPLLRAVPWEYLYDDTREEFLALSVHTPLTRQQKTAHQIRPLTAAAPLRVLVVMAGPEGYPPLAVGRDWRALLDTVDYLAADGRMTFERLVRPTLFDLQRRLRQQPVHLLHFIGFAVNDPQLQCDVLVFEDEAGRGRAVSGEHFGRLLNDQDSLRLALLDVRNAARSQRIDPGSAIAEQLVRRGLPAALYLPSRLRGRPSLAFLHELYEGVANLRPVDEAVAEARRAALLEESGASWGLPQLVSRVGDGQLFARPLLHPTPAKPPRYLRSVLNKG